MSFLLARIEHAARAFLRGGDLDRRVTRSAVEHEAFHDEFPDGPYIPGHDYTPGPGAMQDMGANCAAAAEMFPQYTKASVARPPGAADGPVSTSPRSARAHTLFPQRQAVSAGRRPAAVRLRSAPPPGTRPPSARNETGVAPGQGETPTPSQGGPVESGSGVGHTETPVATVDFIRRARPDNRKGDSHVD